MRRLFGVRPAFHACGLVFTATMAAVTAIAQQPETDLDSLLAAVSRRVDAYYARAQSLVCTETVRLQPIDSSWNPSSMGRTLVYDLRMEWDEALDGDDVPEPVIKRELRLVNGRPPRPKDEPDCLDPKPASPDSLSLLLPMHRGEYLFRLAGAGSVDHRPALMLDYRGRTPKRGVVTWKGECISIELPGHFGGRVWIDRETDQVLRLDEHLIGVYEFPVPREHVHFGGARSMLIERADTSTRYRAVTFHDPDETLVLPEQIDTYQVIRRSGVPQLRVSERFSEYRRFITGARLVKPQG